MEKIVPDEFERRKREELEEATEEEDRCLGGYAPWEAVAAAQDISFGHMLGVRVGTPGIVVCNSSDDNHITVKFETREDESDLCVDVLPCHLMKPLPGTFRLNQKVMVSADLHLNGSLVVRLGCAGKIVGPAVGNPEYLLILFEERLDGIQGYIAVEHKMILPHRSLVGGYKLGQKVSCNKDLFVNDQLLVAKDAAGKVIGEYSDTRLTVAFDVEKHAEESDHSSPFCEGSHCLFNVQPFEIRVFRDVPCNICPGDVVRAKCDLGIGPNLLVVGGTRGLVQTYMDELRITVAFDGNPDRGTRPQLLTVSDGSIEKADSSFPAPRQQTVEESKEQTENAVDSTTSH